MKFAESDMKFQRDLDTILDNWSPITRRWRKNSGDLANTNSLIPKNQKEGIVLYERG